jgi:probable phosphoglycerate mutase
MVTNATEPGSAPPRRRIYLMRHGEVDYFDPTGRPYRPQTVPLNAEGRLQAQAAARDLARLPLDRAITSGLVRSVETASLVTAGRDLPLETRPQLREIETGRMSEWGAAPAQDVERAVLGCLPRDLASESRFLAGETFGALRTRVTACWAEILARRNWQHLLIVAHGVVNRLLLSEIMGAGLAGLGALEQDAGCINLIDVEDAGRCLIRLINHTPANPLKAGMALTTLERLYQQYRQGRAPDGPPG